MALFDLSLARIAMRYPYLVKRILSIRPIFLFANKKLLNKYGYAAKARPRPFSLFADYTTWPSLFDKSYTGLHLQAEDPETTLPPFEDVVDLWRRKDGKEIPSEDTSVLFSYFAQWFTDSFLRTDIHDWKRNTSNHEIDFCQLYGMTEANTRRLRLFEGGKLKYSTHNHEVYPPRLFDQDKPFTEVDGKRIYNFNPEYLENKNCEAPNKCEMGHPCQSCIANGIEQEPGDPVFSNLFAPALVDRLYKYVSEPRLPAMFATGLEHGNAVVGYSFLVTVFLREHNRIAEALSRANPDWDDERLFQTARMVNNVLLLKIVLGDYVNHVASMDFPFEAIPGNAEKEAWYRTNWIAIEFDLLYRWHSMVPDKLVIGGLEYEDSEYRFNNDILFEHGVTGVCSSASEQLAGKIGLQNTHELFFRPLDRAGTTIQSKTVKMARDARLQPMNKYRVAFGLKPYKTFEDLTGDPALAKKLSDMYRGDIDAVEWHVGIFAEKHDEKMMLGDLMVRMVAHDAFTHALTNPLLSKHVYGEKTFSEKGLEIIDSTSTLFDVVNRNTHDHVDLVTNFNARRAPPGPVRFKVLRTIYDTIDFLFISGWKRFFDRRIDINKSHVFRGNLFKPQIFVTDYKAFDIFNKWDEHLEKEYSFGAVSPPPALTGNTKPIVFRDDETHDKYKGFVIRWLKENAMRFEDCFNKTFATYAKKWETEGTPAFTEEVQDFAASFLFEWYFEAVPDPRMVSELYLNIFGHKPLWWHKLNPKSKYNRDVENYQVLRAFVMSSPGFQKQYELAKSMGLENKDELCDQMLFIVGMNNFLGFQNISRSLIGEINNRQTIRRAVEMELNAGLGDAPVSIAKTTRLTLIENVIKETLRMHPPVLYIYGKAKDDLLMPSSEGVFVVKKGERLTGAIIIAQNDPRIFPQPDAFIPDRFIDEEYDKYLVWSHGTQSATPDADNHSCPGKDVAMLYSKLFISNMVHRYEWALEEEAVWDMKKTSLNTAAPKGNLKAKYFRAKTAPAANRSESFETEVQH